MTCRDRDRRSVNLETGRRLVEAGADILVAGSYVFGAEDPEAVIAGLAAL